MLEIVVGFFICWLHFPAVLYATKLKVAERLPILFDEVVVFFYQSRSNFETEENDESDIIDIDISGGAASPYKDGYSYFY